MSMVAWFKSAAPWGKAATLCFIFQLLADQRAKKPERRGARQLDVTLIHQHHIAMPDYATASIHWSEV